MLNAAELNQNVQSLFKTFTLVNYGNVLVDVVASDGRSWVKVVARNAQALHIIWQGNVVSFIICVPQ